MSHMAAAFPEIGLTALASPARSSPALMARRRRRRLVAIAVALLAHGAAAVMLTQCSRATPPAPELDPIPVIYLQLAPRTIAPPAAPTERKPAPPSPGRTPAPHALARPPEITAPSQTMTAPSIAATPVNERPQAAADPPQPTPSDPAPSPSPPASAFQSEVLQAVERARRYPPAARARREEGVATVRFRVARNGRVLQASIIRSAGSLLLDREAADTVRRAQLPSIPANMTDPLDLVVAIEFFVE